jgi:hypothetical protein
MYKAATVSVTDSDWTEIYPDFDIQVLSVYSEDGAFNLQVKQDGSYGDSVKVYKGLAFNDEISANRIRIKSLSGTLNISYYLSDKKA